MPKINEYQTVRAQVKSFEQLGCSTSFEVQGFKQGYAPKIRIFTDTKLYRLSEPCWDVVISQLAKLHRTIKNEKRMYI